MPTSKLYRAFPELDQFDDDRCERFVRAAQGGRIRRTIKTGLCLFVALVLFGLLIFGASVLVAALELNDPARMQRWGVPVAIQTAVVMLGVALIMLMAGVVGLLTRDRLLRKSVRRVLADSGSCWQCQYRLLGLPVSADDTIRCPECGAVTRVDRALEELTFQHNLPIAAGATFIPHTSEEPQAMAGKAGGTPSPRPRLARAAGRKKRSWKWPVRIVLGSFVLLLLAALGWEVFIRQQAVKAQAMRSGTSGLVQHVLAAQPGYSPQTDAWPVLMRALAQLREAESTVQAKYGGNWPNFETNPELAARQHAGEALPLDLERWVNATPTLWPDYISVVEAQPGENAEEERFNMRSGEVAAEVIQAARDAGLFRTLREVVARPHALRSPGIASDQPLYFILMPENGESRALARLIDGRVRLAVAAGDIDEALDAIEDSLAIGRVFRQQGMFIDFWIGSSIEGMASAQAHRLLFGQRLGRAQLERLSALLSAPEPTDAAFHVDTERLVYTDAVCWLFSKPENVRFGVLSPQLLEFTSWPYRAKTTKELFNRYMQLRLGTLQQNLRVGNAYFDHHKANVALPLVDRAAMSPQLASAMDTLVIATAYMPSMGIYANRGDVAGQGRLAAQLCVAIELHRARTGAYPASLRALEGGTGSIIDPLTGTPFGYRLLDEPDKLGRSYLLYSFGPDGSDNQGTKAQPPASRPRDWIGWQELPSGTDYIFNEPRP